MTDKPTTTDAELTDRNDNLTSLLDKADADLRTSQATATEGAAAHDRLCKRYDALRLACVGEISSKCSVAEGIRRLASDSHAPVGWRYWAAVHTPILDAAIQQPAQAGREPKPEHPEKPADCNCWFPRVGNYAQHVSRPASAETKHAKDCPAHLRLAGAPADAMEPYDCSPENAAYIEKIWSEPLSPSAVPIRKLPEKPAFVCPKCGGDPESYADARPRKSR